MPQLPAQPPTQPPTQPPAQPMTLPYPETVPPGTPVAALFNDYLDGYRATVLRKVHGLDDDQLRTSLLPSGWTPLEMLRHLAAMERRWIEWGFLGAALADPYPDRDLAAHRWRVPADVGLADIAGELDAAAALTRRVIADTELSERSAAGGQFDSEPTPDLAAVLFHVLQEYARHAGQLDVVRELIDSQTGE